MKIIERKEDEDVDNVSAFTLLPGGKGDDDNWLLKLPIGTTFLSREKDNIKRVDLNEYLVLSIKGNSVHLRQMLPDGKEIFFRVDSLRFSRAMDKYEVLEYGEGYRS